MKGYSARQTTKVAEVFEVSPTKTTIRPKDQVFVTVTFCPLSMQVPIEALLVMLLEVETLMLKILKQTVF